jgi:hypothetical protein
LPWKNLLVLEWFWEWDVFGGGKDRFIWGEREVTDGRKKTAPASEGGRYKG